MDVGEGEEREVEGERGVEQRSGVEEIRRGGGRKSIGNVVVGFQ